MRAYLYFTWNAKGDQSGFVLLKKAMLHDVAEHIFQLGESGFLFLTDKTYEQVEGAIKDVKSRAFMLLDITDGISSQKVKTSMDISKLLEHLTEISPENMSLNAILDKMLSRGGLSSLTRKELDYLESKSDETKNN